MSEKLQEADSEVVRVLGRCLNYSLLYLDDYGSETGDLGVGYGMGDEDSDHGTVPLGLWGEWNKQSH